jgi:hypothetical protein
MTREAPSEYELEFNALRNALYHTARRQRLEGYARFLNLIVILGGTAVVIDMANSNGYSIWVGFSVAFVGSLQLVFDFSGRASKHEILQRRFYDILSQVHSKGDMADADRRLVMAELMRVYGDEPPTMRALDAVAFNEAVDAIQGDGGSHSRLKVSPWQYVTRHVFAYNGTDFAPEEDMPPNSPAH